MIVGELMELARELNPDDVISQKDLEAYIAEVLEALAIHIAKEEVRRGLWKDYPASHQNLMIVVKADRIKRSLEGAPTQAQIDNTLEENHDIINYAIFGNRKLKGTA